MSHDPGDEKGKSEPKRYRVVEGVLVPEEPWKCAGELRLLQMGSVAGRLQQLWTSHGKREWREIPKVQEGE